MPLARASHRCAQSTSTTENNRSLRYRAHVDHRRRRPRPPDPGSPRCRQRVGHRRKSLRRKRQCHSCQEPLLRKHEATLCLRTQVKCHKLICHNELRSNSKISQAVFIRSHTQSQRAALKPFLSKRHRHRPAAGSRLGVDTRVVCRPGSGLDWPCCRRAPAAGGPRDRVAGPACRGVVRGGHPGRAWGGGAWRGLAELVQTIMTRLDSW